MSMPVAVTLPDWAAVNAEHDQSGSGCDARNRPNKAAFEDERRDEQSTSEKHVQISSRPGDFRGSDRNHGQNKGAYHMVGIRNVAFGSERQAREQQGNYFITTLRNHRSRSRAF